MGLEMPTRRAAVGLALALCAAAGASAQEGLPPCASPTDNFAAKLTAAKSVDPLGLTSAYEVDASDGGAQPNAAVRVAEHFEVEYYYNYKIVRNLLFNETYVLTVCGVPPKPPKVPWDAKHFNVPLSDVSVTDTTVIAYMELLGLRESILYVDLQYATNPCLHLANNQGLVTQVEPSPDSYYNPGNELIYDEQMAAVDGLLNGSPNPDQPKAISFSASADPGPLHRSEWLKFVSFFYNMELEAEEVFSKIAANYECTKAMAAADVPASDRPGVAFISYSSFSTPPEFVVSVADYKLALVADAGARNVDTSNMTVQISSWSGLPSHVGFNTSGEMWDYLSAQNVSVIVDESYSPDPVGYNLTSFLLTYNVSALPGGVKTVLREDGILSVGGGLDWFEGAIVMADAVLQDLAGGIYGHVEGEAEPLRLWFRDLTAGAQPLTLMADDCPDVLGPNPWNDVARTCDSIDVAFQGYGH